ncbi:hypothetical protein [Yoonia sp.]|uniref:hypothetical protein n=1 Tax=Yoonia sp. TaxID=2212373 RepID=UPI00358EE87F
MFIVYIAFGMASGLIALIVSLLSGGTLLAAFGAYVLAGMVGMFAGLVWASIPKKGRSAKHAAAQRS